MLFVDLGNYQAAVQLFEKVYSKDDMYEYVNSEPSNVYITLGQSPKAEYFARKSINDYFLFISGYLDWCSILVAIGGEIIQVS